MLLLRIDARSFLGASLKHSNLLTEVIEAQLVPPVGKDRIREYCLVQRVEVVGLEESNLLLTGAGFGQCIFHCLKESVLNGVPFLNAASHKPPGKVCLKYLVA